MKWYLDNWYNVGVGVCIGALALGVVLDLNMLQQILLLNFAVLLLHEFEEYGWPGGLPTFMNEVMFKSTVTDRYPLDQRNSLFTNVILAYPFYVLPIVFPDLIWLAAGPILFNFFEFLIHVAGGGLRAKARYGPGLATVVLWLGLSIWYIAEVSNQGLATTGDLVIGVVYMFGFIITFMLSTYRILAGKDSRYPFNATEMSRFERYRHLVGAAHQHG